MGCYLNEYERRLRIFSELVSLTFPKLSAFECVCCKAEVREKMVRNVASVLGETEQILGLLEDAQVTCSLPERKECVDD